MLRGVVSNINMVGRLVKNWSRDNTCKKKKKKKGPQRNRLILHFTVLSLVIRSLSRSEAQDDFIQIQTFQLFKDKLCSVIIANQFLNSSDSFIKL